VSILIDCLLPLFIREQINSFSATLDEPDEIELLLKHLKQTPYRAVLPA